MSVLLPASGKSGCVTGDCGSSVEAAKEVCRNTKGPVASIFYQGLDRAKDGVDSAEKAVISYGGVQMGQLEMSHMTNCIIFLNCDLVFELLWSSVVNNFKNSIFISFFKWDNLKKMYHGFHCLLLLLQC